MFALKRHLFESRKALLNYLDSFNSVDGAETLRELIDLDLTLIEVVEEVPPALLQAIRKNGKALTPERIIQEIKPSRFPYIYPVLQTDKGRLWIVKQVKVLKELAKGR